MGRIIYFCIIFPIGLVKDGSKTLRELNVTNGVKMMVVGSTINDVMKVTPPPPGALKEEKATSGRVGCDERFSSFRNEGGKENKSGGLPFRHALTMIC